MRIEDIRNLSQKIKDNIEKVIVGKSEVIDVVIAAVIAGGHVLLEDVPGTGKTVLAKSLAKSINANFKRVQFTPDLLPSDLTGINYFNQKAGEFVFRQGPLFTNILLGDEINRATPRTQSSLLECMEEKQISIDGKTYKLDEPFFVIATQNPVEIAGTFPLPEAQLDRFLIKINIGYPNHNESGDIIDRFTGKNPMEDLRSVCTSEDILNARKVYTDVFMHDEIKNYILNIIDKTREHKSIKLGVSPRGMLSLVRMCLSFAAINGRDYVTPDDVKKMSKYVLPHRMIINDSMRVKGIKPEAVLEEILNEIPVPTEKWK